MDLELEEAALGLGLALLAEGLRGRNEVSAEANEVGGGAGRVIRLLVVVGELVGEHEIARLPRPVSALLAAELLDDALLAHRSLDDGIHFVCGPVGQVDGELGRMRLEGEGRRERASAAPCRRPRCHARPARRGAAQGAEPGGPRSTGGARGGRIPRWGAVGASKACDREFDLQPTGARSSNAALATPAPRHAARPSPRAESAATARWLRHHCQPGAAGSHAF